tara:strand:+ start:47930 stop:49138 length:1209 start_codon:yes stop_codon:yes gene_type:complete
MNWQTKTLAEVAYTAGRIGWKGLTAKEYTESGPYFLSVHSLNYGDFVDFRDAFHITDARYEESPEIMIKPNDILICKDGAGIGKVGIVKTIPGPTTINSSLLLIRPLQDIEPKLLYYKLCSPSFQKIVQERIEGATTPHLYQREIKNFLISLPGNTEQKRIVAILDQAFADIEQARAKTEQNLKNARELFESYLQKVFSQRGEGWVDKRVEEIADLSRGQNPPKSEFIYEPREGYVRFYQIRDGKSDKNAVYVPASSKLHYVEETDILMVAYRHVGGAFRGVKGAFNVALCKITNKDRSVLHDDFLFHLIPSSFIKGELMKASERSLIPSMSVKHLAGLKIPIPPPHSQDEIVRKINIMEKECKRLEFIYKLKLDALDEMKKSILQKAFSGELTKEQEGAAA